MALSCWRSRNSRWLFSMPSRTSSAILSLTSISARWSLVQSIRTVSRSATSGLQQLPLLLVAQIRGVTGQVGQRRGIGDPVDGVDDLPGVAALQGGDDQRLVLGGQLLDRLGVGRRSRAAPRPRPTGPRPGPETPEPILTRRSARITAAGSPVAKRPIHWPGRIPPVEWRSPSIMSISPRRFWLSRAFATLIVDSRAADCPARPGCDESGRHHAIRLSRRR